MSVTADIDIRRRSVYNPTGDRSLPESIWFAQGAIIGDSGGGHAELNIILNPGSQRSGRSWSLEIMSPFLNVASVLDYVTKCENLDLYGPGLTNPVSKSFIQLGASNSNVETPESGIQPGEMNPRLYLGSQATTTTPALIRVQTTNVDLNTFGLYASGYEWGPEATALGPRKPPGAILG